MKKAFTLFAALFLALGIVTAQDVYFSGNGNGTGKIWKNNTLIYSMSDTTGVIMTDMKVANDSTLYSAGRTFSDTQSHVWMNDSVVFTASDNYEISTSFLLAQTSLKSQYSQVLSWFVPLIGLCEISPL